MFVGQTYILEYLKCYLFLRYFGLRISSITTVDIYMRCRFDRKTVYLINVFIGIKIDQPDLAGEAKT